MTASGQVRDWICGDADLPRCDFDADVRRRKNLRRDDPYLRECRKGSAIARVRILGCLD